MPHAAAHAVVTISTVTQPGAQHTSVPHSSRAPSPSPSTSRAPISVPAVNTRASREMLSGKRAWWMTGTSLPAAARAWNTLRLTCTRDTPGATSNSATTASSVC